MDIAGSGYPGYHYTDNYSYRTDDNQFSLDTAGNAGFIDPAYIGW
jgi:hypothetical protein